jgi:hypothetical protein
MTFLFFASLERKGFDSVTPYMHCLVYHVPFFTKKYGKQTNGTQRSMPYKFEKG